MDGSSYARAVAASDRWLTWLIILAVVGFFGLIGGAVAGIVWLLLNHVRFV